MELGKQIILVEKAIPLDKYDVFEKFMQEAQLVRQFYGNVECFRKQMVDYGLPIPDDLMKRVYYSEKRKWRFFKLAE